MVSKKKEKKHYVSKADLAEFLLLYEEEYRILRKKFFTIWICFLFYLVFLILVRNWYSIIIILIIIVAFWGIYHKKRIVFGDFDESELINYIETPGTKRKKSFKNLLEKIEKVQYDHLKMINYSKKWMNELFDFLSNLIIWIASIFLGLFIYIVVVYALNGVILVLGLEFDIIYLASFSLVGIGIIYLYLKLLDYSNVDRCVKSFEIWIEDKLSHIMNRLWKIISSKNEKIELDIFKREDLQQWYEFYCGRYSDNDNVNNISMQYHDLIFTPDDEYYYLETFSEVRGKINDQINYLTYQTKKSPDIDIWKKNRELIDNYIEILEKSIQRKSQQQKEKLDKAKSKQIFSFYIFSILNLGFSITSIIISLLGKI